MDVQVTQFDYGYESVGRRQVNPVDGAVLAAQEQLDAAYREFYSHVDGREFMDCDEYWEKRAERLEHIDACNIALAEAQKNAEAYWSGCTCTPLSNACEACKDANKVRYGDSIPVEGI